VGFHKGPKVEDMATKEQSHGFPDAIFICEVGGLASWQVWEVAVSKAMHHITPTHNAVDPVIYWPEIQNKCSVGGLFVELVQKGQLRKEAFVSV